MKRTNDEILKEIERVEKELAMSEQKYSKLGQIDMLSGEGNELRKCIANYKGQIDALKWTIKLKTMAKSKIIPVIKQTIGIILLFNVFPVSIMLYGLAHKEPILYGYVCGWGINLFIIILGCCVGLYCWLMEDL